MFGKTLEQLMPGAVDPAKRMHGILRERPVVRGYTIDGRETHNIDDGFEITAHADGTVTVAVSVPDVPAMIPQLSALDLAASNNIQDIYGSRYHYRMLPRDFVTNYLTLSEGQCRPAITFATTLDRKGAVIDFQPQRTVFQSRRRMCWDDVDYLLSRGDETVKTWLDTADALYRRRQQELIGAWNDESAAAAVRKLPAVAPRIRESRGEHIVSELMNLTRRLAADYMKDRGLLYIRAPGGMEIHERGCFYRNGYALDKRAAAISDAVTAKIKGSIDYANVTCPNRRYVDIVNLRVIGAAIDGDRPPYGPAALQDVAEAHMRLSQAFQMAAQAGQEFSTRFTDMLMSGNVSLAIKMTADILLPPAPEKPGSDVPPSRLYSSLKSQLGCARWPSPQFSLRALIHEGCRAYGVAMLVNSPDRRSFNVAAAGVSPADAFDRASWQMLGQLSRNAPRYFKTPSLT